MKRRFDRTQRVADLIQKTLAHMLLTEMDERFRFVTITSVTVSRDLSYAKVYVSVLADEEDKIKQIVEALNNTAKSLRYNLAHEVDLRVVPELKFVYDESTARGFKISSLIDNAVKKSEKKTKE
ncbi:30S ribosome-binding factor RbfA [Aquicella lusitana]|uniref:Ribosome-binding factor A n=1 Tax=Aquicella lusitana TaxID=254246 RepID=A0A370GGK0_9COXI|nr:30S ribosome-binding factor RbfA [Aquicella lusitana]RDI42460.1 ribosome-binding factor A [Aquicella lusitana]VVC74078.1 Ribosome-binding factor A [Aquicella lusitana]